tara:strand:- start:85 stop:267 length:183 start_codon:yes stop_codon:yes gene_type:complete
MMMMMLASRKKKKNEEREKKSQQQRPDANKAKNKALFFSLSLSIRPTTTLRSERDKKDFY